ncbi:MAG: hypothetical protein UV59_C0010G0009 [Candidatus Gottesmanbacteria bacterium GW2011_GWA1_43_11]|uniref:Uncharacterized protein n=1 Tax=Candidatus Gottesmanbacteria bacterium GW2011_GWA1_43_11 TaxID=1618436 RepID=A0A0G1FE76_9BACT|nr:MAG: hypothetical protein UV59_C0010G0009 [Candidatus Gottesmanbacteria bacterium GW2011_GWA1_43_11]
MFNLKKLLLLICLTTTILIGAHFGMFSASAQGGGDPGVTGPFLFLHFLKYIPLATLHSRQQISQGQSN